MTERSSHRLLEAGVAKFTKLTRDSDPNWRRGAVEKLLDMTDYAMSGHIASIIIAEKHPHVLALKGNSFFCDPPGYTTIAHAVSYHQEPAELLYEKMPEYSALRDSDGAPVLHWQVVASHRVAERVSESQKFLMVADKKGFTTAQVIVDWVLSDVRVEEYGGMWLKVFDKLVDASPEVLSMGNDCGGRDRSVAYGKLGYELTIGQAIASYMHDSAPEPGERPEGFASALRRHIYILDEQTKALLRTFPG
jgi:hypothetical protein